MGQSTQQIKAGTLQEMVDVDMGGPLHAMIICGTLHELEIDLIKKQFLIENSTYQFQ